MTIPDYTLAAINRYVEERVPPSGFLSAVLENNLMEAFGRADENNRAALFEIVSYLYNDAPSACWGSPAKVSAWLSNRCTCTPASTEEGIFHQPDCEMC